MAIRFNIRSQSFSLNFSNADQFSGKYFNYRIQSDGLYELTPGVLFEGTLSGALDSNENLTKRSMPLGIWTLAELRIKSDYELRKLQNILFKEKNRLLIMRQGMGVCNSKDISEKLARVKVNIQNLKEVLHERNGPIFKLEAADRPERTIISLTYKKPTDENLVPFEVIERDHYSYLKEIPYDMPKLSPQKQFLKRYHETHQQRNHKHIPPRGIRPLKPSIPKCAFL